MFELIPVPVPEQSLVEPRKIPCRPPCPMHTTPRRGTITLTRNGLLSLQLLMIIAYSAPLVPPHKLSSKHKAGAIQERLPLVSNRTIVIAVADSFLFKQPSSKSRAPGCSERKAEHCVLVKKANETLNVSTIPLLGHHCRTTRIEEPGIQEARFSSVHRAAEQIVYGVTLHSRGIALLFCTINCSYWCFLHTYIYYIDSLGGLNLPIVFV